MSKKSNPFIVIEALDAGGSQTQTDRLVARLKLARHDVLALHFPDEHRATGQIIYHKFLLESNKQNFSKREQALLFIQDFFSRQEDIKAHLAGDQKRVVVSDRFCTSTMAYQTIGLSGQERERMLKWITWLCWQGTPQLPKPDAVVFIDTPVEVSLQRLRSATKDYFENQDKLTAIRNSYLRLAKEQNWHILSGVDEQGQERTRQDLGNEIWHVVQPLITS